MQDKALLMSIKPDYAEMIFSGKKTVELRRTRPKVKSGDLVIVYVSSPIKAIRGAFEVENVLWGKPSNVWEKVRERAGVSQVEFETYFYGADIAFGIELKRAWECENEMNLSGLREQLNLEPPQSFRYLNAQQVEIVNRITQPS